MNKFIEIITFPANWLKALYILEILTVIFIGIRWNLDGNFRVWKIIICIVLIPVLFIATYFAFILSSQATYRKSMVDASPIAELSSENIINIESALNNFEAFDFILNFKIDIKPEDDEFKRVKSCSFLWYDEEKSRVMAVSVNYYADEQTAVDSFMQIAPDKESQQLVRNKTDIFTYIENNNNTEVRLFDSYMIGSDTPHFPDSSRRIDSKLRIGNAVIWLTEDTNFYSLKNNISSEFIKLLCSMMSEQ